LAAGVKGHKIECRFFPGSNAPIILEPVGWFSNLFMRGLENPRHLAIKASTPPCTKVTVSRGCCADTCPLPLFNLPNQKDLRRRIPAFRAIYKGAGTGPQEMG